jgi:phospholipid transport system substrate-binding protein
VPRIKISNRYTPVAPILLEGFKGMKRSFFGLLSCVFLFASTVIADPSKGSPKAEMVQTIDSIISIAGEHSGDSAKTVRRQKLRELINPKFNFAEMSKRSLGANWNDLSARDQSEFTKVFSELLARTYLSKIETVKPGMVKVESEQIEPPRAVVKTVVISNGDSFPIDYKMMAGTTGSWQVYDVVIENIGLVANYRNEFSGIIRKDKFSGLMERLHKKVD